MTLILCSCGRYFRKYGNIVAGEPAYDKTCVFKCPHCGKTFTETPTTRQITRMLNGETDYDPSWD